jgi:hypothetical protein
MQEKPMHAVVSGQLTTCFLCCCCALLFVVVRKSLIGSTMKTCQASSIDQIGYSEF